MIAAISDTHTAIWYIFADDRLFAITKDRVEEAATQGDQLGVSAIPLAEIVHLKKTGSQRVISLLYTRTHVMPFSACTHSTDNLVLCKADVNIPHVQG